ncbi:MAG: ATP synthase subunit F [Mesoaciditoga sp.]|uniref:V-type ATP synthase subunit F n=1 Tax=Athalassotoga sp. TaxID=2022597 RepID=UPI000CC682FA|nr:MAG: ATP synthase subunit F [Mesoaciditoga sp.]PMP80809.1 MAG: ATP synthase subunit F [Mesoaciditoga sp.]HEU23878.1 ATP synthase subunit F [Mesoaciditoga lauensis]
MRFFLISDNIDTYTGMRLAGINGVVLHKKDEIISKIYEIRKDKDVGVLLITEKISEMIPEELDKLRKSRTLPIVTVIPDRHGSRRSKDFLTKYVQEAIGVKVG